MLRLASAGRLRNYSLLVAQRRAIDTQLDEKPDSYIWLRNG
jgi:hypothetical protein